METSADAFDEWMNAACEEVCEHAKADIRNQQEQGYRSVYLAEISKGTPEDSARMRAWEALGNPYHAKQRYRREYITQDEMNCITFSGRNRFVNAIMCVFMLGLFYFSFRHTGAFAQGNPLVGGIVWVISVILLGIYIRSHFFVLPKCPLDSGGLSKIIITTFVTEHVAFLWFCAIGWLSTYSNLSFYSLSEDLQMLAGNRPIFLMLWVGLSFAVILIDPMNLALKINVIFKLSKRRDYLSVSG